MWQVNYPAGVNLVAMMSDATADGVCLSCLFWLASPIGGFFALESWSRVTAVVVEDHRGGRQRGSVRDDELILQSGGVTSLFKVQDGSQTCQMRSTDADFT